MNRTKVKQAIAAISKLTEEELAEVKQFVQSRERAMSLETLHSFRRGDECRIKDGVRPRYLAGQIGKIEQINNTRAVVSGLGGRFEGVKVRVPATLIERV